MARKKEVMAIKMMIMNLMIMMTASIEIVRVKSSQAPRHMQTVRSITYKKVPTTLTSCGVLIVKRNLNTLLTMRIEKRQIVH